MAQKVVVIGHSFSSRLSIIRSIAQIGCEITVIVMTGLKRDGITNNAMNAIVMNGESSLQPSADDILCKTSNFLATT